MDNSEANGELKDGLIVCQTGAGVEVHGTLVKLTRFAVVFEIYSPGNVLQLSEVLNDFRIIIRDHTLYWGHATVRNLMNTGQVILCEATLNETSWRDVQFNAALLHNGALGDRFGEFLREWQKMYKVLPEFKTVVADIQVFLTDLRLWLEQLELGIRAMPTGDRAAAERELVDGVVPPLSSSLNHLFEKFELIATTVAEELQPVHSLYVKRQLHPLLLCSPFMHRIYQKPLGYAGDYEMVNMILRDPHEGSSVFSKMLNRWFLSQIPAEAHRNRVRFLTSCLASESLRTAARGGPLRVFNLGCGPAREVADFMEHSDMSDRAEFTLLDFNEETLRYTEATLNQAKRRYGRSTGLRLVKKSVANLVKARNGAEERYDAIYCAGLFDYLQDRVCKQLMNVMYSRLAPGGLLIATNVDATNPIRRIMDFIFEWHLLYRTGADIAALTPEEAPSADACKITADPTGCNVFIEVRKPAAHA